jgi:hypothetical protein
VWGRRDGIKKEKKNSNFRPGSFFGNPDKR